MRRLPKSLYLAAGATTTSLGPGRPEFHPLKARPGLRETLLAATTATLAQIPDPSGLDEGVIGNFMAARFNHQGHLGALLAGAHPALHHKPMIRVEGACASGGLALATALKNVASGMADSVLVAGIEVQNTVKAVYGADILAGAGYYDGERKAGHPFFFPGTFSDRAGAYAARFGAQRTREAMAAWFAAAIEQARLEPTAQEHHNGVVDLRALGLTAPDGRTFCEHLNLFDCSKVSDGAASLVVASAEGLDRLGIPRSEAVEVVGLGQAASDLAAAPDDLAALATTRHAALLAQAMAGVGAREVQAFEVHDCFTITGILSLEALGLAAQGEGVDLVLAGANRPGGPHPTNLTGGLIGWGHPTGASGVRMAVDLLRQLKGRAGQWQLDGAPRLGQMVSMGGNDKTVVSLVLRG